MSYETCVSIVQEDHPRDGYHGNENIRHALLIKTAGADVINSRTLFNQVPFDIHAHHLLK